MKTITLEDFHSQLKAQGVPITHCAFKCPVCQTIQSGNDLINAGAGKDFDEVHKYLGFSCVGRFTGAGSHKRDNPPGHGCNWTLGGLLQVHKLEVVADAGDRHPRFELASPEEAQAHWLAQEVAA